MLSKIILYQTNLLFIVCIIFLVSCRIICWGVQFFVGFIFKIFRFFHNLFWYSIIAESKCLSESVTETIKYIFNLSYTFKNQIIFYFKVIHITETSSTCFQCGYEIQSLCAFAKISHISSTDLS